MSGKITIKGVKGKYCKRCQGVGGIGDDHGGLKACPDCAPKVKPMELPTKTGYYWATAKTLSEPEVVKVHSGSSRLFVLRFDYNIFYSLDEFTWWRECR